MIYRAENLKRRVFLAFLLLFCACGQTAQNLPAEAAATQNPSFRKPAPREDFERDEKLQADADALLPLFDNMPQVPIYLKDEPILKGGTNTEKGTAYTHCYGQERPTIFVKKSYYKTVPRKQFVNALKHELTHAWLCRQRLMSGHDERFRRKFNQVGGFGN